MRRTDTPFFSGFSENKTPEAIAAHILLAAVSLFINGFGIYLTILAGIGAAPWDVFNLGLSKTFGILYGTASVLVSASVLLIDILMREPIGIAMFIDAVVVGKSVDLFRYLDWIPAPEHLSVRIGILIVGLFIIGYTQYLYMLAALGCGPRDTLLIGLKRRLKKIPIGVISICLLAVVTLIGGLLGGQVGIGTLLCAFGAGPIMQFAFRTVRFDPTGITHQDLKESGQVFLNACRRRAGKEKVRRR